MFLQRIFYETDQFSEIRRPYVLCCGVHNGILRVGVIILFTFATGFHSTETVRFVAKYNIFNIIIIASKN